DERFASGDFDSSDHERVAVALVRISKISLAMLEIRSGTARPRGVTSSTVRWRLSSKLAICRSSLPWRFVTRVGWGVHARRDLRTGADSVRGSDAAVRAEAPA